MSVFLNAWSVLAVLAGGFFFFVGSLGLLRFPDAFTRLHALTKADNLGLGLVVLGLSPQMGSWFAGLKVLSIWLLVLLSASIISQMIARTIKHREL